MTDLCTYINKLESNQQRSRQQDLQDNKQAGVNMHQATSFATASAQL